MAITWKNYSSQNIFDELINSKGQIRSWARPLCQYFQSFSDDELRERQAALELAIRTMGITFTVYSEEEGGSIDRAWPLDMIPRVIPKDEWSRIERGLQQRVKALNLFINDIYNSQKIIRDHVFPAELLENSSNFRQQCMGIKPKYGVWAHICGSDLIRDINGTVLVLEDNLRVPSGVSYMLQNRKVMKRVFPDLFELYEIQSVDAYTTRLYEMLASLSPRRRQHPQIVVLTPGIYNSAYFEHAFLASEMGAELVEGSDLIVDRDNCVYMRTVGGLERVDVIYRRVDDLFLDPEVFNEESMLGVPGLMRAWQAGNVALANAPGAGVADDKVVYAFVPEMIRYYLDEDAILPNVETYLCIHKDERDYVLKHLDKLVVKAANESGGYGMLIGPQASKKERDEFARRIRQNPRNYIAQPLLTLVGGNAEPRHLDLRPFILSGKNSYVTTGGLTRVALRKGSTVVNSSQGGGSKDTWIINTA